MKGLWDDQPCFATGLRHDEVRTGETGMELVTRTTLTRSAFLRHIATFVGGCALATVPLRSEAQTRGGVLVMLVQPEPPTLAGYLNTSTGTRVTTMKVYEGLLTMDFTLRLLPNLAKKWAVSPDGKNVTFTLQDGVQWHDGQPFTSADVQFSILEVLKKFHPLGRQILQQVEGVDTPDARTAIFRLARPAGYLLRGLADTNSPIVPKHLLAGTDITKSPLANKPVGTGPYRFVEWQRGQFIRFERNPRYWRRGLPYLDGLVARFIPDGASRANALETGEAQLAGYGAVPFADAKRLAGMSSLRLTTEGGEAQSTMLVFDFNTLRKPFNDPKVRQAIAYAIDRNFVLTNIWFGFGKIATGPISSNLTSTGIYTADVKQYNVPNGVERANKLLDEAGYAKSAAGVRFEIIHDMTPYGDEFRRFGEYTQQALAKIGIKATLRYEDVPTWLRRIYTNYDFDLTSNWIGGFSDPAIGIHRFYTSANIKPGVVFSNDTHWSSPRTDELISAATVEGDPAKRNALYHEFQRLVVEASPYAWILETRLPTVYSTKVHDAVVTANGVVDSLGQVWVGK